jgi:guanidinobutyrase
MTEEFNQPQSGNEMPRFGGQASMFRLPVHADAAGLDVAIIGVPLDIGTSNRPGTRFGPRGIRAESVLVRPYGMATRAAPFDSLQIADIGERADQPVRPQGLDSDHRSLLRQRPVDGNQTAFVGR